MAALTPSQLAKIRRELAKGIIVDFEKKHINTAIETINDLFDSVKADWSTAVNSATESLAPPYTFSNPQKKIIFAYWLLERFAQEVE